MRHIRSILWLVFAFAIWAPVMAQQSARPEPGTPKPFTVPEVREFSLPNGLGVKLIPYGEVPKATVRLVTAVGNVHEEADEIWLADVTGDLMQEGTTTRSSEQIAMEAARMGGSVYVSVGSNRTTVGGEVLAEFAPEGIALLADLARNPSFPASELQRIKANRIRQVAIAKTQPQSVAEEAFVSVLYGDHPYGRLFPTEEMIQGYTPEQVRAFHAAHFGAAASQLYVAGRFDEEAVEAAIREAFGDWERGPLLAIEMPSPASRREVHLIDRPGAVQSTIYLGLPVVDPSHPDYLALQVTDALLGGAFGSRITTNIREDKGYTYSPQSYVSARFRDAYWVQVADVTTEVTGPSLHEIFFEIDRLRSEPPAVEELRGIQNYLAGVFVLRNSTRGGIIGQVSFLDLHGLGRDYLENYVQRIHAVTPEEVQRIAQTYLDPDRMAIVIVGDRSQIEEQVSDY